MGAILVTLLLTTAAQSPPPDSIPLFSSPAVHRLVERAMARRHAGDSLVADYRATVHYRLSVGFGRRVWSRVSPSAVEEQVARVAWQRPNDIRVDVTGRRSRSRAGIFELSSVWDRPWFVPRGVDDSVRIFSNDFPATGALHPLARTGPEWYRYTLTGALTVTPASGGTLHLLRVEVMPRRTGPALIAGQMWIDSASAEVVRLSFRYIGTALWVRPREGLRGLDSARARRLNRLGNRVANVDVDLEYGLQEGRYWMPFRQVIAGKVKVPVVSDLVIPFQAVTTFEDYEINTGRPIVFTVQSDTGARAALRTLRRARREVRRGLAGEPPDSLRSWDFGGRWSGGRYELHRPSNAELDRYDNWPDSLSMANDPADARRIREMEAELARLAEALPPALTGERTHGIAYERLSDAFRYDRVQGLSAGLGYRVRVPGMRVTDLYGTIRYGFSDERVTGRLTLRHDAPSGRLTLSGYREIIDLDPFSPGHGLGNTLDALFVAHDNADYALGVGGSAGFETSLRAGLDLVLGAKVERQESVSRPARSAVNDFLGGDGRFPPNPPVRDGTFGAASARLRATGGLRWNAAADVLGGDERVVGRLYGDLSADLGGEPGATLRLAAGIASDDDQPQSLFRLGGVSTVRGFDYGTRRGQAIWAAQLDATPFGGRLRPVAFVDAGQASRAADLFSSEVLVGAGLGLSLFHGLLRFDLSHPITPDTGGKLRFDIVVQAVR
ncbi:MAG TPA: hypothetical protein VF046_05900 [Gemmatimonadales bacterium]